MKKQVVSEDCGNLGQNYTQYILTEDEYQEYQDLKKFKADCDKEANEWDKGIDTMRCIKCDKNVPVNSLGHFDPFKNSFTCQDTETKADSLHSTDNCKLEATTPIESIYDALDDFNDTIETINDRLSDLEGDIRTIWKDMPSLGDIDVLEKKCKMQELINKVLRERLDELEYLITQIKCDTARKRTPKKASDQTPKRSPKKRVAQDK